MPYAIYHIPYTIYYILKADADAKAVAQALAAAMAVAGAGCGRFDGARYNRSVMEPVAQDQADRCAVEERWIQMRVWR